MSDHDEEGHDPACPGCGGSHPEFEPLMRGAFSENPTPEGIDYLASVLISKATVAQVALGTILTAVARDPLSGMLAVQMLLLGVEGAVSRNLREDLDPANVPKVSAALRQWLIDHTEVYCGGEIKSLEGFSAVARAVFSNTPGKPTRGQA